MFMNRGWWRLNPGNSFLFVFTMEQAFHKQRVDASAIASEGRRFCYGQATAI